MLRRGREQVSSVNNNPLPQHGLTVGMITIDEEFTNLTQLIVSIEEVVGVTEVNHRRARMILSGKEFMSRYRDDIFAGKMKSPVVRSRDPFVLEDVLSTASSSDQPFVLDVQSFELKS